MSVKPTKSKASPRRTKPTPPDSMLDSARERKTHLRARDRPPSADIP